MHSWMNCTLLSLTICALLNELHTLAPHNLCTLECTAYFCPDMTCIWMYCILLPRHDLWLYVHVLLILDQLLFMTIWTLLLINFSEWLSPFQDWHPIVIHQVIWTLLQDLNPICWLVWIILQIWLSGIVIYKTSTQVLLSLLSTRLPPNMTISDCCLQDWHLNMTITVIYKTDIPV